MLFFNNKDFQMKIFLLTFYFIYFHSGSSNLIYIDSSSNNTIQNGTSSFPYTDLSSAFSQNQQNTSIYQNPTNIILMSNQVSYNLTGMYNMTNMINIRFFIKKSSFLHYILIKALMNSYLILALKPTLYSITHNGFC